MQRLTHAALDFTALDLRDGVLLDEVLALDTPDALSAPGIAALGVLLRAELNALLPFVASPLVRRQLHNPQPGQVVGEFWRGTVLFADLSGFTALSERLSALGREGAEEVRRLISQLFAALLDELHTCGGAVLKFGGDALTAFFDATTLGEAHAALACSAALAMQRRMAEFAALDTRAGRATLRLRIGVHSGRVFAAQVGDADHTELVVTGRQINRVALAQESADPGEVVVSDETMVRLQQVTITRRSNDFFLLRGLAAEPLPPPRLPLPALPDTASYSLGDLQDLARRVLALRPYLTRRLPERFIGTDPQHDATGEFRPVSVLFANFYPFSTLLDTLGDDTATAALVLNSYYRRAQQVVHHYDGSVNKVDMASYGDKFMALFGAPVAHEDDAERAVYAALDMRRALDEANVEVAELLGRNLGVATFQQRIGINTGTVFAGLVGSAARHEYTVMGSNVNLAARLMGIAEDGHVVLSPATRRVVAQRFACDELDPVRLKGLAEPIRPCVVRGVQLAVAHDQQGLDVVRFEAPLVGRAAELATAHQVALQALGGQGGVLAITGDPGAGKTRLAEELLYQLVPADPAAFAAAPAFALFNAECQSFQQTTPYAPLRGLLRRLLGIGDTSSPQALASLEQQMQALAPALARFGPLLAAMLDLPAEETPLIAALSAEQRRDRLHELVVALVRSQAALLPLVLLLDDVQWIDEASHGLLASLAAAITNVPALLVLTYRAGTLAEPWTALPHCTGLLLAELSDAQGIALADALLGGGSPAELAALLERAQGNPLFVEELVRTLVEQGVLVRADDRWQLSGAETARLPDTIEGIITARLDLLAEEERNVLQVASVIGRRFLVPVLSSVYGQRNSLPPTLDELADHTLILPEGDDAVRSYLFRQALTRDVAYESILFARRRELNRRVAEEIARLAGADRDAVFAPLARHYLLAEEWSRALYYHLQAGKRAADQFANRSAIALLEQALAIAPRLRMPEAAGAAWQWCEFEPAVAAQLAEVLERLGAALTVVGEYDAAIARYHDALVLLRGDEGVDRQQLGRLYRQIGTTCERKGDFEQGFAVIAEARNILGLEPSVELARIYLRGAALYQKQANYLDSIEWAEHARLLASKVGSPADEAHALMLIGGNRHSLGEIPAAIASTRSSLETFQRLGDLAGVAAAYNNLAGILHDTGEWDEAQRAYRAAAELEQSIGDLYGQAKIANNLGEVLKGLGDLDGAIEQYTVAWQRIQSSQFGMALVAMNRGSAYLLQRNVQAAEESLIRSHELFTQTGSEEFRSELLRYQADLQLLKDDASGALTLAIESAAIAERLEAPLEQAVALRVKGQALMALQRHEEAEVATTISVNQLREIGNRHELARALLVQAQLLALSGGDRAAEVLREATMLLKRLGAGLDLRQAARIAQEWGYALPEAETKQP